MDPEKLTIKGHRFTGIFEIKKHVHRTRERVDSEVGWHMENRVYEHYEGKGLIKDGETGSEQRFLVYPEGSDEAHLIVLENEARKRVQDYLRVVDLSLQGMFEDARDSSEIIPEVRPVHLDISVLSEKVLILTPEDVRRN